MALATSWLLLCNAALLKMQRAYWAGESLFNALLACVKNEDDGDVRNVYTFGKPWLSLLKTNIAQRRFP
jgi:hypothetical protein